MSDKDDWTTCLRCGAIVDQMSKHRRWHEKLEGTSEPEKGEPGEEHAYVF